MTAPKKANVKRNFFLAEPLSAIAPNMGDNIAIIMEEADGVESGSAPQMINHPSRGYVM